MLLYLILGAVSETRGGYLQESFLIQLSARVNYRAGVHKLSPYIQVGVKIYDELNVDNRKSHIVPEK